MVIAVIMVVLVLALFLALTLIGLLSMKEETVMKLRIPEVLKKGILSMQKNYIRSTSWYKEEEERKKRIEEAERKAIVYVRSGSS